jgi:hypothetical protein
MYYLMIEINLENFHRKYVVYLFCVFFFLFRILFGFRNFGGFSISIVE